jgi:hypothetical protein
MKFEIYEVETEPIEEITLENLSHNKGEEKQ